MKYPEGGGPQPLVGAGHRTTEYADRVGDIRTSVSGTVQEGTAEALVPLHEFWRCDMSILASE